MEHVCNKEEMLGQMAANLANIRTDTEKIDGLVTDVAVLETKLESIRKDVPTMRKMMTLGAMWGGVGAGIAMVGFFGIKAVAGH